MPDPEKKTLSLALKGLGLHFAALVVCISIAYFSAPISLPSSGTSTIWLVALLLLLGFVSLLKLLGHLIVVVWQGFWFFTAQHSPTKRYIELWICVCCCIVFGVTFLYCGVNGLVDGKVIFPLSRHSGEVSLYDSPSAYWLSVIIWISTGALIVIHTLSHGGRMLWALNGERIQPTHTSNKR